MIPEKRKCIICGEEFMAHGSRECLCSYECRRKRQRQQQHEWYMDHWDSMKLYHREWKKTNAHKCRQYAEERRIRLRLQTKFTCSICGKPINSRFKTHTECVVNQCAELIRNDQPVDRKMCSKLNAKGWTVRYLRKIIKEQEEGEIKWRK